MTETIKEFYWHNYKTGEYELRETPTDFTDYIPQLPAAQGLYKCHIAMGLTPIEACKKTLLACIGRKDE